MKQLFIDDCERDAVGNAIENRELWEDVARLQRENEGLKRLRLYELPAAFAEIERQIDEMGGELPAHFEETLDVLEGTLEDKADAVASVIVQAKAEAAFFDAEIKRLSARKAVADGREARLKEYLHRTLTAMDRKDVKGRRFAVRLQRNSAPSIWWTRDTDQIPDGFRRVTVDVDPEKAREAFRAGALPDGFEATVGTHVRIR